MNLPMLYATAHLMLQGIIKPRFRKNLVQNALQKYVQDVPMADTQLMIDCVAWVDAFDPVLCVAPPHRATRCLMPDDLRNPLPTAKK
jgi:hypothetical protein